MSGGPQVFFTSDTHFDHRLVATLRGYETPAEHDEALVETWNAHVRPSDIVWHLGDVSLGGPARWAPQVARLNGTIHLVAGNHDRCHPIFRDAHRRHREYLDNGFATVSTMAHRKISGIRVVLSHFPYAGEGDRTDLPERHTQWRLRDLGVPLLHGHTHSSSRVHYDGTTQVHVGWDAWRRPVRVDEVYALLAARGELT